LVDIDIDWNISDGFISPVKFHVEGYFTWAYSLKHNEFLEFNSKRWAGISDNRDIIIHDGEDNIVVEVWFEVAPVDIPVLSSYSVLSSSDENEITVLDEDSLSFELAHLAFIIEVDEYYLVTLDGNVIAEAIFVSIFNLVIVVINCAWIISSWVWATLGKASSLGLDGWGNSNHSSAT
jgi:hypothetical protein